MEELTAPLLVVHGGTDTNVPVSESEQIVEALRRLGRTVRYLLFDDDGHEISKRENRETLAAEVANWLASAFTAVRASLAAVHAILESRCLETFGRVKPLRQLVGTTREAHGARPRNHRHDRRRMAADRGDRDMAAAGCFSNSDTNRATAVHCLDGGGWTELRRASTRGFRTATRSQPSQ